MSSLDSKALPNLPEHRYWEAWTFCRQFFGISPSRTCAVHRRSTNSGPALQTTPCSGHVLSSAAAALVLTGYA